jgi:hypothetical protein
MPSLPGLEKHTRALIASLQMDHRHSFTHQSSGSVHSPSISGDYLHLESSFVVSPMSSAPSPHLHRRPACGTHCRRRFPGRISVISHSAGLIWMFFPAFQLWLDSVVKPHIFSPLMLHHLIRSRRCGCDKNSCPSISDLTLASVSLTSMTWSDAFLIQMNLPCSALIFIHLAIHVYFCQWYGILIRLVSALWKRSSFRYYIIKAIVQRRRVQALSRRNVQM